MSVTFFLDGEKDVEALRRLDPDRDWREFQTGERAWILQTYLRLVRAGYPAELSASPPSEGLVVFHAKHSRALRSQWRRLRRTTLLGVRADNREPLIADFEVVQNGFFADEQRRFFLPHWPQPALIPRDDSRGASIRRIAFKGFEQNLHSDFQSPAWRELLAGRGIEWKVDAVPYAGAATDSLGIDWPDFRQVDLLLAVRPKDRRLWTSKPASKLFNAWQAGVPALLGPEHAYRELRRSELDYLEVGSLEEAKAAVLRLLERPDLYHAMVRNGRARGAEFTAEATLSRWTELLAGKLPALASRHDSRRLPLPVRVAGRWLLRTATLRPAR
ncbi:MAG TPA: glycosyltransferase [Thermoanaerobaculia bacterium]|nr:glycosyltransferase [Thermoanaerobaculia bacterium]